MNDQQKAPDSVRPARGANQNLLCGKPDASSVDSQAASAFAAAVLRSGGKVHRIPDGNGGEFQISIINPGALFRKGVH